MASRESTYRVGSLVRQYQQSRQGFALTYSLIVNHLLFLPLLVLMKTRCQLAGLLQAKQPSLCALCSLGQTLTIVGQLKNKRNALILRRHQIGSRVKMKLQATANQLQQLIAKERKLGVAR